MLTLKRGERGWLIFSFCSKNKVAAQGVAQGDQNQQHKSTILSAK